MLTASADVAFAGPKKLPRLKATKLPRVALPQIKVPPTPVVPNVAPAVERAVTAQVAAQTTPRVAVTLPSDLQKDFLTGPQALQTFRPGWKSELMLSGFTRQQLDLVEQAFKETDQFLFETDEEGNWLKPRFAEWNYLAHYTKILTDNAYGELALNDGQIKTLFGKFSRLDDVFTRLNLQAFWLVNKRAPNPSAEGEEGKLARHAKYNLDKRDGRKMNPEVEGYIYGNIPAKLQAPKPSYGPKDRSPRRTPEQVWAEVTQFIREHDGRIPSQHASDDYERKLRKAWDNIYYTKQMSNDPYVVRLIKLHDETVKEYAIPGTPQEVLDRTLVFMKEHGGKFPSKSSQDPYEKSLRISVDNIYYPHKDKTPEELAQLEEPIQQIIKLMKENVREYTVPRTPQEVLDATLLFMKEHGGKLPSESSQNPYEKSLRKAGNKIWQKHKDKTPEELAQLEEPVQQIVKLMRENVREYTVPRTPQEVLDDTLTFMKEHGGKLPSEHSQDAYEKSLRLAGNKIWQKHKDKTPEELAQLEEPVRQIIKLFRENVRSRTKKQ